MQYYRRIYLLSALSIITVFVLNLIANKYHLYWTFYWFDNMMHFLGGVWLGLLGFVVLYNYEWFSPIGNARFFVGIIIFVLGGGLAWEAFEGIVGAYFDTKILQPDTLDTITDLIFDTIGGLLVAISIAITYPIYPKQHE